MPATTPEAEPAALELLATSVGRPAPLARANGDVVYSAIAKAVVHEPTLELDHLNLAGDQQADLTVHGGVDKAVYSYPSEHWPFWAATVGATPGPGLLGENTTTAGLLETDVHIGDRFSWGTAVVEVSQPRAPCYKLALHLHDPHALKAMIVEACSGWYFRVVEEGTVPTTGELRRIHHAADAPTIHHVFVTTHEREPEPDDVAFALSSPALADQWARALTRRA